MHVLRADAGLDLARVHRPPVGRDGEQLYPPPRAAPPASLRKNVRVLPDDGLVAVAGLGQDAHQVAHRPAEQEQGRLLAQSLGGHGLQAVDGGVLAVDVVADLGPVHRLSHGPGSDG